MTKEAFTLSPLGKIARAVVLILSAYWVLYALIAPVTNVDSQMYNLARVALAERAGLFNNPLWTSIYQIMWPWSFDAIHLPFLHLGFGYALPSFFCMVGICWIAFRMINFRFGADAAWTAVVGLLSLTCLVYQATSTKNDIPVVFAVAVWIYARWRWKTETKDRHLFWMVVSIGFMAGAKTTGVSFGLILSLWMLYDLRNRRTLAAQVFGGLVASAVLLGSVETYVESARRLGHPLGSVKLVKELSNRDGLRGGLGNLTRYVSGSIYLGPSSWLPSTRIIAKWADTTRAFLTKARLVDAGTDARFPDTSLFFFQSGFEELSGFGPIGTVAMGVMLAACFRWRTKEVWWRLAIAAVVALTIASLTIGYGQWNNRYLVGQYAMGTMACTCALWTKDSPWRLRFRWIFVLVAIASAVGAPFLSFNRTPSSIGLSLTDRDRFETCIVPIVGKTRERLHTLRNLTPGCRIFIVVWADSAILPYLRDADLKANLISMDEFTDLLTNGGFIENDLIVINQPGNSPIFVKADTFSAPNMTNQAANGTAPPIVQNIYRIGFGKKT